MRDFFKVFLAIVCFERISCNLDQRRIEARDFIYPPSHSPAHLKAIASDLFEVSECSLLFISNPECFCSPWEATPHFPTMAVHDLAFNAFYYYYQKINIHSLQASLFKNFLFNNPIQAGNQIADYAKKSASLRPNRIPKIVHLLWVTDPENPHPYPDRYIRTMRENSRITLSKCCMVFLWSNLDPEKVPTFLQMRGIFFRSAFKNLKEIDSEFLPKTKIMMEQFFQAKRFSRIADIYRIYILRKMGGLYLDSDVHFFQPIDYLFENYDSVNLRIQLPIICAIESYFFGYKANHPILNHMVEYLEELDGKSAVIPIVNDVLIEYFTQIPMFWALSTLVHLFENRNNPLSKDLLLEFNLGIGFMSHDNERSWKKGEFGQLSNSSFGFTENRTEYKQQLDQRLFHIVKSELNLTRDPS